MNSLKPKEQALAAVAQQLEAVKEIVRRTNKSGDTNLGFEQLRRWKENSVQVLSESVSETESQKLRSKRLGSFTMGQPLQNLNEEVKMYRAFLVALLEDIEASPERVLRLPASGPQAVEIPEPTGSRVVFIIHGHDELNLLRLRQLLKQRWALDSVVLKEKPGKGRTLIEKFEEEALVATFALALLTPDDVVSATDSEYPQARPNVIFELGWFYGRLGREKVCILLGRDTKIHSDLDGISRINFRESVEETTTEIETELKAAGLV
jgi:predicted nucleotide-binding protein